MFSIFLQVADSIIRKRLIILEIFSWQVLLVMIVILSFSITAIYANFLERCWNTWQLQNAIIRFFPFLQRLHCRSTTLLGKYLTTCCYIYKWRDEIKMSFLIVLRTIKIRRITFFSLVFIAILLYTILVSLSM